VFIASIIICTLIFYLYSLVFRIEIQIITQIKTYQIVQAAIVYVFLQPLLSTFTWNIVVFQGFYHYFLNKTKSAETKNTLKNIIYGYIMLFRVGYRVLVIMLYIQNVTNLILLGFISVVSAIVLDLLKPFGAGLIIVGKMGVNLSLVLFIIYL
jgi:hypothetical protein